MTTPKKPHAFWRWTCDRCGDTYPRTGDFVGAVKVDAEAQWKYHATKECTPRLEALMTDV